jgi:phage major head subunit gpT-like protein
MIGGNVPQHLVVGARTGFLAALPTFKMDYQRIAMVVPMNTKDLTLTDLGASPMPTEDKGRTVSQDYIERSLEMHAKDYSVTVDISQNAIDDDQTGDLNRKVRSAGERFKQWVNNQCFKALNDGDATTNYGACYDGNAFYSASHVDKGADYQTAQDNVSALALTIDNFETVRVASKLFVDDRGEEVDHNYNLLVVPPNYERLAGQICRNPRAYDTANAEINTYQGVTDYIVSPKLDSTAWILVAGGESTKPIIIGQRRAPSLLHAWFEPDGPEGGLYKFKFYARYAFGYGDWRLAHMGHS